MKYFLIFYIAIVLLLEPLAHAGLFGSKTYGGGISMPAGISSPVEIPNLYAWYPANADNVNILSGSDVNYIYDTSGNSRHLQAGSSSAYPDFMPSFFSTGRDAIYYNNVGNLTANTANYDSVDDNDEITVCAYAQMTNSDASSSILTLTQNSNINSGIDFGLTGSGSWYFRSWSNGSYQQDPFVGSFPMTEPQLFCMRFDGNVDGDPSDGNVQIWVDGILQSTMTGAGAFNNNINRAYWFGSPSGTYRFDGYAGESLIYDRALSDDEMEGLMEYMLRSYLLGSSLETRPNNIVVQGDSLSVNPGSGGYSSWQEQLEVTYSNEFYKNKATAGGTCSNMASNLYEIDVSYNASARSNKLFLLCGTNDINTGVTALNTIPHIQTLVNRAYSNGYSDVYVMTIPERGGSYDTERYAFNALIVSNSSAYNYTVVDLASEPEFDSNGDELNTTYYYDQVHFTTAGHTIIHDALTAYIQM